MSDLTLYHAAPSRSSIALWMLEEIGEPYEIHLVDLKRGDNRQPHFLTVNPMGKVPVLRHRGVVVTELAAICLYLADAFPKSGLAVPIEGRQRGTFLKWLFFTAGPFEMAVTDRAFKRVEEPPPGMLGYGDYETVMNVVAEAVSEGPYLLGEQFTAADVVLGSHIRWGTMFKTVPERPEFTRYLARITSRPAAKRAEAKDELLKTAS